MSESKELKFHIEVNDISHIEVLVLGLNTENNTIYVEENGSENHDPNNRLPIWITKTDKYGNCTDGVRANIDNWFEEAIKMVDTYDGKYPLVIAGSMIYYAKHINDIKFDTAIN